MNKITGANRTCIISSSADLFSGVVSSGSKTLGSTSTAYLLLSLAAILSIAFLSSDSSEITFPIALCSLQKSLYPLLWF